MGNSSKIYQFRVCVEGEGLQRLARLAVGTSPDRS